MSIILQFFVNKCHDTIKNCLFRFMLNIPFQSSIIAVIFISVFNFESAVTVFIKLLFYNYIFCLGCTCNYRFTSGHQCLFFRKSFYAKSYGSIINITSRPIGSSSSNQHIETVRLLQAPNPLVTKQRRNSIT